MNVHESGADRRCACALGAPGRAAVVVGGGRDRGGGRHERVDAEAFRSPDRIERDGVQDGLGRVGGLGQLLVLPEGSSPAAGTQNVAPNTPITLTFSAPVSLQKTAPTLSPAIAGRWVQTNAAR